MAQELRMSRKEALEHVSAPLLNQLQPYGSPVSSLEALSSLKTQLGRLFYLGSRNQSGDEVGHYHILISLLHGLNVTFQGFQQDVSGLTQIQDHTAIVELLAAINTFSSAQSFLIDQLVKSSRIYRHVEPASVFQETRADDVDLSRRQHDASLQLIDTFETGEGDAVQPSNTSRTTKTTLSQSFGHRFGDIVVNDQANVQLGDQHIRHVHIELHSAHKSDRRFRQHDVIRQKSNRAPKRLLTKVDQRHGIVRVAKQSYHRAVSMGRQHATLGPSLIPSRNDTLCFSDALDRTFYLPTTYFAHWPTFQGFLRHNFRQDDIAGGQHVEDGAYMLTKLGARNIALGENNWTSFAVNGARIVMDVVITDTQLPYKVCPRPACHMVLVKGVVEGENMTCPACQLNYKYDPTLALPQAVREEQRITKFQVTKDLHEYGLRLAPNDVVDLDSDDMQDEVTTHNIDWKASCYGASDEPGICAREDRQLSSECSSSSVDTRSAERFHEGFQFNDGGTRLSEAESDDHAAFKTPRTTNQDAEANELVKQRPSVLSIYQWLSDTSSSSFEIRSSRIQSDNAQKALAGRERQDLNAFKRVVFASLEPSTKPLHELIDKFDELDGDERTYTIKVVDKFPSLPLNIARRLAQANVRRKQRLNSLRDRREGTDVREPLSPIPHTQGQDPAALPDNSIFLPALSKVEDLERSGQVRMPFGVYLSLDDISYLHPRAKAERVNRATASYDEVAGSGGILALCHQGLQDTMAPGHISDITPRNMYEARAQHQCSNTYSFQRGSFLSSAADSDTDYDPAPDTGYTSISRRSPGQLIDTPLGPPVPQSMRGHFRSKISGSIRKKHKCKNLRQALYAAKLASDTHVQPHR